MQLLFQKEGSFAEDGWAALFGGYLAAAPAAEVTAVESGRRDAWMDFSDERIRNPEMSAEHY